LQSPQPAEHSRGGGCGGGVAGDGVDVFEPARGGGGASGVHAPTQQSNPSASTAHTSAVERIGRRVARNGRRVQAAGGGVVDRRSGIGSCKQRSITSRSAT
jgi:hypothetical protein